MPLAAVWAIPVSFDMPYDGKATVVIDDASGQRVRNLVSGIPFKKGRHTVEWDGRAEDRTGAAPGRCTIRVVTHPGLSYEYRGAFAAGGEKLFSGFGPNHLPCSMSMARGDRVVVASLFTEGGNSTLVLRLDGSLDHGWGEGWSLGNKACVYLPGTGDFFYSVREKDGNELQFMGYDWTKRERPCTSVESSVPVSIKGAAQIGDRVFIANGLSSTIDVYSIEEGPNFAKLSFTGERRPCPQPGPLTVVDGEIVSALNPKQKSIASDRALLYAIEEGSSVIHVYDRKTGKQVRTIGEDGGGYTGPWRRDRLVRPTSCALDSNGFLWVTEERYSPKRITKWDVKKGTCVYEKIGSERYGTPGGGMDGEDATRWMAHDTEWRYDPAKGVDAPVAQSMDETVPQDAGFSVPPREARTYKWVRRGGRTYLIGMGADTMFWEYVDAERRLRPIGMVGSCGLHAHVINRANTCESMRTAYRRAFPELEGQPDAYRYDEETLMVWRDRNGNERFDADEFEFAPRGSGGTGGWGLYASDLDFTCGAFIDGEYRLLDFRFPEWSMSRAVAGARRAKGRMPAGVGHFHRVEQLSAPGGRFVFTGATPYMLGFDRDGLLSWYMSNPFPNVHGSQKAGLPQPGELQGVLFALGTVPCGKDGRSDCFALKNNHGRIFFITTDGIYLDELFSDCRVAAANDETYIGGESFGGSFEYDRKNRRAVLSSGGGGYRWYEIRGLDAVSETTFSRTFSARELVEAQEKYPLVDPRTVRRPVADVPASQDGALRRVAEWHANALGVWLDGCASADRLNLRFSVQEPSPWVNNGTDRYEMFKTGDCVDFQFLRGKSPVRVMVYPKGDGAEAVVYDFDGALAAARGESAAPHDFASPWRRFTAKHVFFPTDLGARVERGDGRYAVSFSLPLAWLSEGGRPMSVKADFGIIFGDRDGTINQSRVYWSNKETGLVNDVPGEIMPEPNAWGTLRFGAADSPRASARPAPRRARLGEISPLANADGILATDNGRGYHGQGYGVGPVYDSKRRRLYFSVGAGRIAETSPKGVPYAVYELPGARPFDRFDSMTITENGEIYVLAGGLAANNPNRVEPNAGRVYRIRPGAKEDAVACIASNICAIAQHVRGGELACVLPDSTVGMLSLRTFSVTPYAPAVRNASMYPCMLDWTPDGELYGVVEHVRSYRYRKGAVEPAKPLFGDREIGMTRGTIIGDELWVLAGATIKRYDAREMKGSPGVVYGGASGYFLGRVDMNHEMYASGICALGNGYYAVHTHENSAVYIMRYDAAHWRLREVRRIGGFTTPGSLVVDDEGMLMCDGLVWPFDAEPSAPPSVVQVRMPMRASALLPGGCVSYITETHGSFLEARSGRLAEGEFGIDWGRDRKPYPEGQSNPQKWGEATPVATFAVPADGGRSALCALLADGTVKKYMVDAAGHFAGDAWFAETRLTPPSGVEGAFESAAPLPDGKLLVAAGGKLCIYEGDGAGGWRNGRASGKVRANALASDGSVVAAADASAGTVRLYAYEGGKFRQLAEKGGLNTPSKIALKGGRMAVWERDTRRLVRIPCDLD